MSAKGCVTRSDCGRHGSSWKKWRFVIILLVLLALVLIALVVVLIIFLAVRPHKPRFYLQSATVRELNVSDGLLTSNLQFSVVSHNPNDRVGVIYDSLSTHALYLGQQITGEWPVPPFYQGDNDMNVFAPTLYGISVPLATAACENLDYERRNGLLSLSLKMDGTIRWKVGTWTSGHYHLNVNCWAILGMNNNNNGIQSPLQPGTTCHVEV